MNKNHFQKNLEIVISTMNSVNLDFLQKMFKFTHFSNFSILIINQTSENRLLHSNYETVRVINSFEKGLSKSRNLGLKNAQAALVLLTDDDIIFKKDFVETIINSFNKYPKATVIQFKIDDFGYKKYSKNEKLGLSTFRASNIMSIELAIKRSFLIEKKITYDELFGLGSIFKFGEENILISDILSKKGIVHFIPITIAQHPKQISVNNLKNKDRYFCLGAFYVRQFSSKYILWVFIKLFFDIKHKKIKIFDSPKLLSYAIKGKKEYEKYGR